MGKVSQLTWDLSKALSNRLPHTSASGEKALQGVLGAWDMFSCRSSYSTLKIHIFLHSSSQPHSETRKLCRGKSNAVRSVAGRTDA